MAVKQQINKIRHLKKYQPKYNHAHEKAVFKAAAIVRDTKNIVTEIDHQVESYHIMLQLGLIISHPKISYQGSC